jgi:predicted transcriptional regulator
VVTLKSSHGRSRIWLPDIQRGVTFDQMGSGGALVHVYDERFDVDTDRYHNLVFLQDQSAPLREQDSRPLHWLVELFTEPLHILHDVREVLANIADAVNRPRTLYLHDAVEDDESAEGTDDEEMEEDDDEDEFIDDQDVDMLDVDEEYGDHQEAAEEYLRYHPRIVNIARR